VGFYRSNAPAAGLEPLQDFYLCQFWPVNDPTAGRPTTTPAGTAVVVAPSAEGASLVAQADLPIKPHGAVRENATARQQAAIRGTTGYVRTWPMGARVRRLWALRWDGLRPAERATLDAFFRTDPTFRWLPPEESSNVAVGILERPQWTLDDARQVWACTLQVAELLWLDP